MITPRPMPWRFQSTTLRQNKKTIWHFTAVNSWENDFLFEYIVNIKLSYLKQGIQLISMFVTPPILLACVRRWKSDEILSTFAIQHN